MKVKRKLFCTFLAVCFIFIVQPGTVFAAGERITVNGTNILQAPDQTVSCGSGTARYDSNTKTLTLENAVINTDSNGEPLLYGVNIEGEGVTVELIGNSTINAHYGIASSHPLNIRGTSGGKLTVRIDQNKDYSSFNARGIFVEGGGLTVRDANLELIIGDIGKENGQAIYICGNDNLISNSHIEITGRPGSGSSPEAKSQGINATGATSLTISDNASVIIKDINSGIGADSANLAVSGSQFSVNAEEYAIACQKLEIVDQAEVDVSVNTGVAMQANSDIIISQSSVNTESKQFNALLCGSLEIKDSSEVTANSYHPGLFATDKTVIKDSFVEANSTKDVSIYCKGAVEFTNSEVKAVDSTLVLGDISITGGKTEIGTGSITSKKEIHIGGIVTSNGVPSYDNIKNDSGDIVFGDADYSAVDTAITKAEALNKADYTNFEEVEKAIDAVVRGKNITEQDVVDGYAAAIETAVANLKPVSTDQNTYKIIEGGNQTIVIGKNKGVTIKVDGDFDKFVSVSVDGKEITKENYTAVSGSTIITLKPEYVNKLSAGTHTVAINYTDGTVETKLTLKEEGNQDTGTTEKPSQSQTNKDESAPGTGDKLPIGWIIALVLSAVVGLAACKYRMKLS